MATEHQDALSSSRSATNKSEPSIIEAERSPSLRDYLDMLTEREPFIKDVVVSQDHVIAAMAAFWPNFPEWNAQAYELWQRIENVVRTIPLPIPQPIRMRITVAASELAPNILEEPSEIAAVATFDATNGIERSYVLEPHEVPPSPEKMKIHSGVMVVCQAVPHEDGLLLEKNVTASEFGENVFFSSRLRDKPLKGEDLTPDSWKKNLAGLPFYVSPEQAAQVGGILGPDHVASQSFGGLLLTDAALANFIARRHQLAHQKRGADKVATEQNGALLAVAALPAAALAGQGLSQQDLSQQGVPQQERRTYPHERRTYPHERRGPGRMDYFGPENSGTIGLLPVEREEIARLGRIAASAEQELTSHEASELIADNLEFPATPMRPEAFLAMENVTDATRQDEIRQLDNQEISPFAPPANVVEAAAATELALAQRASSPEITPALSAADALAQGAPQAIPGAGTPATSLPEAPPLAAETTLSMTTAAGGTAPTTAISPTGTEPSQAIPTVALETRGAPTTAAPETSGATPLQTVTPVTETPRSSPLTAAEPILQQAEGQFRSAPEFGTREGAGRQFNPEDIRATAFRETTQTPGVGAQPRVEPQSQQPRAEPRLEPQSQQPRTEARAETRVEPQSQQPRAEAYAEPRVEPQPQQPRTEAQTAPYTEIRPEERMSRPQGEHPQFTDERTQRDAFERAGFQQASGHEIHPDSQGQERAPHFYEAMSSPQPQNSAWAAPLQWGRQWSSTVQNLSTGLAAVLGFSRRDEQARPPNREERSVFQQQMKAEKRREAAQEHQPAPAAQVKPHPQATAHRPSEEPSAPEPE